ncbi:hypothetical protein FA13DRAFT_1733624 [Coprinellus micaceus]|uniref:Uncharacterized protein n=1 Tax=Coprinellus micaceus TaxID=71717 RepID=A0A4Y7T9Q8_COPMI|nr:hypothetical protein FA13DRAFT_1733624 [Coprinellus micaceus]
MSSKEEEWDGVKERDSRDIQNLFGAGHTSCSHARRAPYSTSLGSPRLGFYRGPEWVYGSQTPPRSLPQYCHIPRSSPPPSQPH